VRVGTAKVRLHQDIGRQICVSLRHAHLEEHRFGRGGQVFDLHSDSDVIRDLEMLKQFVLPLCDLSMKNREWLVLVAPDDSWMVL
jgi:hypothetical protein